MVVGPQGEKGDTGPVGPSTPFWQVLLQQLPAILTALAACIGSWAAYNASRSNAVKLDEHKEVLTKVETEVGAVKTDIGQVKKDVGDVSKEVKREPEHREE